MLMEATACHRLTSRELDAEVRDSSQFEMPTPRMFVPSHLMVHQILYLNFEKGFNAPHTPNSQVNSAINLGCANYLVASVICYCVHSHLAHC